MKTEYIVLDDTVGSKNLSTISSPAPKPPASPPQKSTKALFRGPRSGQDSPLAHRRSNSYASSLKTNPDSKSDNFGLGERLWTGSKTYFSRSFVTEDTASYRFGDINNFRFINMAQQDFDTQLLRQARRASLRLDRLANTLRANALEAGQHAFVEEVGVKPRLSPYIFHQILLDGNEYFLYTQGLSSLPSDFTQFAKVHFLSGICLFGFQTIRGIDQNGQEVNVLRPHRLDKNTTIQQLICQDKLSFYEQESVLRLGRYIADMAAALPKEIERTISFDIPRIQYYFYMLDLLREGRVSYALFAEWIGHVDRRYRLLQQEIEHTMQAHLQKKGITQTITFIKTLDILEETIRTSAPSDTTPSPTELAAYLAAQNTYWQLVSTLNPPQTYHDLANISYVVEAMQRSLCVNDGEQPAFLIDIENHWEKNIYRTTERLAKRLRQQNNHYAFHMIGMYPLEMIFGTRANGRTYLYDQASPFTLEDRQGRAASFDALLQEVYT